MNFADYRETIKERLLGYFDIEENFRLNGFDFDLHATYNLRSERYIASKKFTVYAFENDEYVFLKYYPQITEKLLNDYIEILKESIKELVTLHDEHMSTTLTGVLVVDNIEDKELIRKIEKFKYQKGFLFGLKGWADIRLILVNLQGEEVTTCKKGKNAIKFYQP